ncbi:SIS domain-containing protein [Paenibacillus chitinolyticus]|uniref:D-sedoheptulose-7-phosphate isomerase n=1 Tax=Paenibacillus chitinolyticus TaxID=79263 RepID=UPI0035E1A672
MKKAVNRHLDTLVRKHGRLEGSRTALEQAFAVMEGSFRSGGKLLVCGNGGSASDAEHIVGELMKGFRLKRPPEAASLRRLKGRLPDPAGFPGEPVPSCLDGLQLGLPAISLVSQTALVTAVLNDLAADAVFAQQVLGYGNPGDVLLGISTSGQAANVTRAMEVARTLGLATVALTGAGEGRIRAWSDVVLASPSSVTDEIQEDHVKIYHTLCLMLEEEFFGPESETEG